MKKLFPLLLILLLPFLAKAQVPAVNDTTLITGSSPYTPQFRYVIYQGYRIPYMNNPLLSKYDFLVTGKYARAFYVPQSTTVAGFPLSGNITLANLSNGIGIAGGTYNGSTARVLTVDTAVIGSKAWANAAFYTKAVSDARFARLASINNYTGGQLNNYYLTNVSGGVAWSQISNYGFTTYKGDGTASLTMDGGGNTLAWGNGTGQQMALRAPSLAANRSLYLPYSTQTIDTLASQAYNRINYYTKTASDAKYAVLNGGNTFTGDQVVNKTSGVNYYSVQAGTLGSFTGGNAAGYTGRAVSDAGGYYNPFIIQQYQAGTSAVFEINAGSNSGNYPMLFKAGSYNLGTIGNNIWNDNDLNRQKGLLNVFSTDGISAGQTDIFAGDIFAMPVGTQIRYCATSTTNAPTTAAGWVEQLYRDANIRALRYRDILGNVWINTTTAYPTWGSWIQVSTSSGSGVYALQSTAINTGYGINGGGDLSTTRNILADTTSTTGLVSKSNLSNALALYPRSTRNITTGYGINGGGNLTADRTLVADTTSATGLVSKSRLATNLTGYFKLNANNTASGNNAFTGNTTFGNSGTAMAPVDVWQGNGFAIIGGADNGANTRTNNTQKNFRLGMPAYVNAQNPVTIFSLNSMTAANQLSFGGGTSVGQAVTNIGFNVSSTVNNGAGSVVLNLNSVGAQVTGNVNVSGLTASQAVLTDASKNLVSVATTGTGSVVRQNTPDFTGGAFNIFSGANNTIFSANSGGNYSINLPGASGTLALTSQLTQVVEITGTTQTASIGTIYIPHNASLTTITLPSTTAIGSLVQVIGEGAGGWKIAQLAGQQIVGVGVSTTVGTGGSIASTNANCTLTLRLTNTNKWTITSSQGTLTPL